MYSLTITGIIVAVLGSVLVKFGFTDTCTNEIMTLAPVAIGGLISWIGRVRSGDVKWYGSKK